MLKKHGLTTVLRKIELVKPGILISIYRECHRPADLIPDVDFLFFLFYSLSVLTGEVV
jgi:hypothetical protein